MIWLVVLGFNATLRANGHITAVGDAHVFPAFLTPVLIILFFPKPPTTFLTCFCRGERRKYAVKKSGLNQGSNSQPPGHESDTPTTKPPGRDSWDEQAQLKKPQQTNQKTKKPVTRLSRVVCNIYHHTLPTKNKGNQSVESAGVAFVS